jgi:hypothetical protein
MGLSRFPGDAAVTVVGDEDSSNATLQKKNLGTSGFKCECKIRSVGFAVGMILG